jgi:hypothetical protein
LAARPCLHEMPCSTWGFTQSTSTSPVPPCQPGWSSRVAGHRLYRPGDTRPKPAVRDVPMAGLGDDFVE